MKRIREFLYNADINRFRFYFQIFAFGILVYGGYLAIDLGNELPTFACPKIKSRGGICYLYPLQGNLSLLHEFWGERGIRFLTKLITFIILFMLFNKAWCGFACPLGTLQDWITKLRSKLGTRYSTYSEGAFKGLKKIKYILLVLLILLPIWASAVIPDAVRINRDFSTPYCDICPSRTILPLFDADITQLALDFRSKTKLTLTALGMAITGTFLIGAFVKKRFFCLFCPMSALHYVFSKIGLLRLTKDGSKCTKCGNCYRVCDVGIKEIADDVVSKNIVKDDCMMCFKCVAACPEEKCLDVKFLGMPVYRSTGEGFFKRMEGKAKNGN